MLDVVLCGYAVANMLLMYQQSATLAQVPDLYIEIVVEEKMFIKPWNRELFWCARYNYPPTTYYLTSWELIIWCLVYITLMY